MRIERDEAFRLELAQRLAHWNSADAELDADGVLPEWFAFGIATAQNALADRVGGHARERLATNRQQLKLARGGRLRRIGSIPRVRLATGHESTPATNVQRII